MKNCLCGERQLSWPACCLTKECYPWAGCYSAFIPPAGTPMVLLSSQHGNNRRLSNASKCWRHQHRGAAFWIMLRTLWGGVPSRGWFRLARAAGRWRLSAGTQPMPALCVGLRTSALLRGSRGGLGRFQATCRIGGLTAVRSSIGLSASSRAFLSAFSGFKWTTMPRRRLLAGLIRWEACGPFLGPSVWITNRSP